MWKCVGKFYPMGELKSAVFGGENVKPMKRTDIPTKSTIADMVLNIFLS